MLRHISSILVAMIGISSLAPAEESIFPQQLPASCCSAERPLAEAEKNILKAHVKAVQEATDELNKWREVLRKMLAGECRHITHCGGLRFESEAFAKVRDAHELYWSKVRALAMARKIIVRPPIAKCASEIAKQCPLTLADEIAEMACKPFKILSPKYLLWLGGPVAVYGECLMEVATSPSTCQAAEPQPFDCLTALEELQNPERECREFIQRYGVNPHCSSPECLNPDWESQKTQCVALMNAGYPRPWTIPEGQPGRCLRVEGLGENDPLFEQ